MRNQTPIIITILALLFSVTIATITITSAIGQEQEKQQIIITDSIKNYSIYGSDKVSSDYREIYTPLRAFDNLEPNAQVTHTYWSDYGDAGFIINLKGKLDRAICSAEILQPTPRNSPFLLTVGSKSVEGVLDSTTKQVSFPECVKNVNEIKLDVKAPNAWTTLSEIKLFTNKKIPPVEPPICPPGTYWDSTLKKCVEDVPGKINQTILVTNSTINFDVVNSTLKIHADKVSSIIIDVNDANVTTTNSNNTNINPSAAKTPIGTPLPESSEDEDNKNDNDKEDDEN